MLGGSVILEPGLQEKDFEELAREGVKVVAEIGLGGVKSPEEAAPMVKWAKKYGMVVMMHTGGTSIPGSTTVPADDVIATDPDIVSHINGGPTAISLPEADKLVRKTSLILEISHCGNSKMIVDVMKIVKEVKAYPRIIIGNDAPSGTGVIPLGILRVINFLVEKPAAWPNVIDFAGTTAGISRPTSRLSAGRASLERGSRVSTGRLNRAALAAVRAMVRAGRR